VTAPIYLNVCDRCGTPTGNELVAHRWSYCRVSGQLERQHYCCPGDCELYPRVTRCAQ